MQAVNSVRYCFAYVSHILLTQSLLFDNNAADGPNPAFLEEAAHSHVGIL